MIRIVGCVREGAVPQEVLADYLLFLLNQIGARRFVCYDLVGHDCGRYVTDLKLPMPSDNIGEVLSSSMRSCDSGWGRYYKG